MDKLSKAVEYEQKAQALRIEIAEEERREKSRKEDALVKKTKVHAYCSSDYAGLEVGRLKFYFGYEELICKKHKNIDDCEDCDKAEWAFVAYDGKKELMRIPESKLGVDVTVSEGLVLGIGHYIRSLK